MGWPCGWCAYMRIHAIFGRVWQFVIDLEEVGVGPTLVLPSVHGMDASKYYYCITSWCKAVTNELVWFGIKTVGVPLSYYWHTLGCAIKHFHIIITILWSEMYVIYDRTLRQARGLFLFWSIQNIRGTRRDIFEQILIMKNIHTMIIFVSMT